MPRSSPGATPAPQPGRYRREITRSALPEVLWAGTGDLALALGEATDEDAMDVLRREGVPHGTFGDRAYVLRASLLAWLSSREGRGGEAR